MYKAIVIGGGPGGYVSAIRIAKAGYKVALIEEKYLGGTCTNVGCIPTKALLTVAHLYNDVINKGKKFGIKVEKVEYDTTSMLKHMKKSITLSRKGIEYLLKKNNVDYYNDKGEILDPKHVKLEKNGNVFEGENLVLAHGSKPILFSPFDSIEGIWTSDNVFSMNEIPKSILIIGGGVIGVELSNFFSMLGKKVYLVELFDHILPSEDKDAAEIVKKSLIKNKVEILEKSKVINVKKIENGFKSTVEIGTENKEIESERVILSVGRKANICKDILEIGVATDKKGIIVDKRMRTNLDNVYAVGDITGRSMLAHVAMKEGIVAAENIISVDSEMDYTAVPSIIFSNPEVASSGLKEKDIKEMEKYNIFKFPLAANARANTMGERDGFVKIIKEKDSEKISGISIVSPIATELITQGSIGITLGLKVESMTKCIFPHPTLSEAILEALEGTENKSIHI